MDSALGNFESRLGSVAEAMGTWNARGSETVQVLKDIASGATSAAAAMAKLAAAFAGQQANSFAGRPLGPNDLIAGAGFPSAQEQAQAQMQAISQGPTITPRIDKTPIEDADRAAAKFIVSWETLSRVVMTQAIVRALSAVRDAMHEAFESNLEFMTRMAEIQSISPGVSTSLDSIAEHVADLSRQFNVPIAQVAEAQYQAISNQFTTTAQQTELLTAALKLSKVAVMDAGQAVNLVAGALNAYRMGSGQAEEVAAQFFATIQVGRVRGEELASVLGRVMAVSSELGVSLEELNAMMVTLTISGVKPAEAATALRSAMMALLKPSQDLKKELHDLGFESGPQMIAALGLEGALLKLRDSVDENMSAFAKLIPNVRAISGALRETDDGGKRTAEAVEHLREVSVAAFNEKYKLFIESDAQKTLSEMNKLKTFLTTDLGAAVVQAVNQFMGFAGGADAIGAAIKALVPVLLTGVAAFGSFAAAMAAAAMSARLAALGLGPLGLAVNGLMMALVAYGAYDFANTRIIQSIQQAEQAFRNAENERLEMIRQTNQRQIDEEDRTNQEVVRRANQALADRRKDYFKMVDETAADNKRLAQDSHATMDKIVSEAEKEVHVLNNVANEANRAVADSFKRSSEIAGHLADTQFRFRGQDDSAWQREEDTARRALSLAQQAQQAMASAKTPQDIESAQNIYKRAEAFSQESMQIAQSTKNRVLQEDAERAIEGVLQSELRGNEQLRASKEKQAQQAAQAAADEERRVTRMRELAKDITKDMDLFDKKGQPLSDKDREQAIAKTKADLQAFQTQMFAGKKWEAADWLNFDSMKRKMQATMEGAVTKTEVRDLLVADQTLAALNRRITTGLGKINLDVFVGDSSKLAGKTMEEQFHIAEQSMSQQRSLSKDVKQAYDDQRDALGQIDSRQRQISANMQVQKDDAVGLWQATKVGANMLTGLLGTTGKAELDDAVKKFREINETIVQMQQHPFQINAKGMEDLLQKFQNLKKNAPWSLDLNLGSTQANLKSLKEMFDYAERVRSIQSKFPNLDQQIQGASKEMDRLQQAFPDSGNKVQDVTGKVSQVTTGIDAATQAMAMFQSQIEAAVAEMDQLAMAAASVPAPGGGGEEMTAAHGGTAFLARGGHPRGTDVIPAMLTPGEMVMSAATTRRFASQLTAMNAGARPSFHNQGGHVTNVGDINVTVQGGGTGRQTARSIATELRRELRRGTSIL